MILEFPRISRNAEKAYNASMEIVLLRHAEPEWVKDGVNISNPPLTDRGHQQAEFLASFLAAENFDEVLVSPLLRTRQTSEPILRKLSRQLVIEDWLEEIRDPIWHGTPQEKAAEAYKAQRAKDSHMRWDGLDGGEAVSDFVERIHTGCTGFLERHGVTRKDNDLPVWTMENPDQKIAFVAHGGTNSVVLCHLLGLTATPWEWERFVIGHATVSRIQSFELGDGHTFGLTRLSGDEHLPATMRTV